jgi:hypothetical protein
MGQDELAPDAGRPEQAMRVGGLGQRQFPVQRDPQPAAVGQVGEPAQVGGGGSGRT